jgi:hypothetical protein
MVIQTPVTTRVGTAGMASRMVLTALGAAGLIVGAFLKWTRDLEGTHVAWNAFYQDSFGPTDTLVKSVGGVSILLGLLAVLGLAERSGWLIRVAGALGIVGVVLFVIQVQSSSDHGMQIGMWFALVGSVLCVAAGLGTARNAVIVDE